MTNLLDKMSDPDFEFNFDLVDADMEERGAVDRLELPREEYAQLALAEFNQMHADDFMTGACDLDSFRFIWDNHKSINQGI